MGQIFGTYVKQFIDHAIELERKKHAYQIATIQEQHTKQIATLQEQYAKQIATLQEQYAKLREENVKFREEIVKLEDKIRQEFDTLTDEQKEMAMNYFLWIIYYFVLQVTSWHKG